MESINNPKCRILLTGASGFLGKHIITKLEKKKFAARILLHRHSLPLKRIGKNAEVMWGSIDKQEVIERAVRNIDCVIHCAWRFSSPNDSNQKFNTQVARTLISRSIEAGVKKFVFVSSVAVYGMNNNPKIEISEASPFATGKDLTFTYPSEKIAIEKNLLEISTKKMVIAVFRPGPLFDENKGPCRKIVKIGPWLLGVDIGNGHNRMPYIHAGDVSDAIIKWIESDKINSIYNVVPSKCMLAKEWIVSYGNINGIQLKPFFIPSIIALFAAFGLKFLKRILKKNNLGDYKYGILCAKRDLSYTNKLLKSCQGWIDKETSKYLI